MGPRIGPDLVEKRRTSTFAGTRIPIVWMSRSSLNVDKKSVNLVRFQASDAKQLRPVLFCRDNSVPTFRDSLLVPSSRFKIGAVYSVGGAGWTVRVWKPVGQETFFLPRPSRTFLGPTRPSVQRVPGILSLGKAAGAWRWPPTLSTIKVKNEWSYISTPTLTVRHITERPLPLLLSVSLPLPLSLPLLRIISNMLRFFSWW